MCTAMESMQVLPTRFDSNAGNYVTVCLQVDMQVFSSSSSPLMCSHRQLARIGRFSYGTDGMRCKNRQLE